MHGGRETRPVDRIDNLRTLALEHTLQIIVGPEAGEVDVRKAVGE